jgi:hypothetical protein
MPPESPFERPEARGGKSANVPHFPVPVLPVLGIGPKVYLCPRIVRKMLVSLNFASWNQIGEWLKRLEAIREAA